MKTTDTTPPGNETAWSAALGDAIINTRPTDRTHHLQAIEDDLAELGTNSTQVIAWLDEGEQYWKARDASELHVRQIRWDRLHGVEVSPEVPPQPSEIPESLADFYLAYEASGQLERFHRHRPATPPEDVSLSVLRFLVLHTLERGDVYLAADIVGVPAHVIHSWMREGKAALEGGAEETQHGFVLAKFYADAELARREYDLWRALDDKAFGGD